MNKLLLLRIVFDRYEFVINRKLLLIAINDKVCSNITEIASSLLCSVREAIFFLFNNIDETKKKGTKNTTYSHHITGSSCLSICFIWDIIKISKNYGLKRNNYFKK